MAEQRVNEARKLGFKTCILPKSCLSSVKEKDGIKLVGVSNVKEAVLAVVGN